MKVRPRVLARNLKLADNLAADNGGVLPNPWRMIQMGHGGLYRYILRHPKKFDHFDYQEAVGGQDDDATFNIGIRQEHLKTAETLVAKKGELPSTKWLGANGYSKLVSYMRIHPSVFSDLKGRNGKTNEKGSGIMINATAPKSSTGKRRRKKRVRNR